MSIIIALFNENHMLFLRILNECSICICYMIILYRMYTKYTFMTIDTKMVPNAQTDFERTFVNKLLPWDHLEKIY